METPKPNEQKYEIPIGTIDLGSYILIINHRKKGGYSFLPVKSSRADYLHTKTKDLPSSSTSVFSGFDPDLLEIMEVGLLPMQFSWHQGRGALEEPQISIQGRDGFEFNSQSIKLFDEEIIDIFTKPTNGKDFKAASLISVNTIDGDILGIALRRNNPVIILFTPSIDGSNMNSKEGLNSFLGDVINNLSQKITPFKAEILGALIDAKNEDYFELPFDSSTLPGKLQNNLLMQIYTIRALFLAHQAENSGLGKNDPKILEHFPYLKTRDGQGKKSGLAGILAGATQAKKLKISTDLWTAAVEDASTGIVLKNSKDRTPRPTTVKSLETRGVAIKQQAVMSNSEVEAIKTGLATASTENKVESSRLEAVKLLQPSLTKLKDTLGNFSTIWPEKLTTSDFQAHVDRLNAACTELKKYTSGRKRSKPPVTATPIDTLSHKDNLKAFGIKGDKLYDFLSPVGTQVTELAIENASNQWFSISQYQDVQLRSNRASRLAKSLLTSSKLAPLAEHIKTAIGLKDVRMINQGMDLIQISFLLLSEKTLYLLVESLEQLGKNGQEIELTNLVHYSANAVDRLIKIANEIK